MSKRRNFRLFYEWSEVPVIMDLPFAALVVGLSPESLKKRCQNGTFPGYKEGKEWRVTKHALFQHIERNSVMPGYSVPNNDG